MKQDAVIEFKQVGDLVTFAFLGLTTSRESGALYGTVMMRTNFELQIERE